MVAYELCRRYQSAVNLKNMQEVLALFTLDAVATAPISGILGVKEFHERLFKHNQNGIARLTNIFDGLMGSRALALLFEYTWIRGNGLPLVLNGVTIFELAESCDKFASIKMIYDASQLRHHLAQMGQAKITSI